MSARARFLRPRLPARFLWQPSSQRDTFRFARIARSIAPRCCQQSVNGLGVCSSGCAMGGAGILLGSRFAGHCPTSTRIFHSKENYVLASVKVRLRPPLPRDWQLLESLGLPHRNAPVHSDGLVAPPHQTLSCQNYLAPIARPFLSEAFEG
jgi:hypothetical protein